MLFSTPMEMTTLNRGEMVDLAPLGAADLLRTSAKMSRKSQMWPEKSRELGVG